MSKLIQSAKQFMNDEQGMGAVEYALIVAVMATAIIAGWDTLTKAISTGLSDVADKIKNPNGVGGGGGGA